MTDVALAITEQPVRDGLEPVRQALLDAARRDAGRLRADAAARADRVVADARARAEALCADARARGSADAAAALAVELSRARREARTAVLRARRDAYEALRAEGLRAVARLRDDPAYGELRDGLTAAARRVLGPEARVSEADGGGVVAEAPGRRLNWSLAAFAAIALDELAAELFEAIA